MTTLDSLPSNVDAFIDRWEKSSASERANFQSFLNELCDILQVPRPDPSRADEERNSYVFEKTVWFHSKDGSTRTGAIDLYKQHCFVLEAKQGSEEERKRTLSGRHRRLRQGIGKRGGKGWDAAMEYAYNQAYRYARALEEEWPPFLIVVDVGHSIELYSDFKQIGKGYQSFPGPRTHRIFLHELKREPIRERLRAVWLDPPSLDPARNAERVTREVAEKLACLAQSLERAGHDSGLVADFLMRLLFTMYAEDVGMLPRDSFTELLERHRDEPRVLNSMLGALWKEMDGGGFSTALRRDIWEFNGRFFKDQHVIPLNSEQIELLITAARADWSDVEPAIFGALLERALDPRERHRLGAHFTPREYVERLVLKTVIEPIREEWRAVKAVALQLESKAVTDPAKRANDKKHKQAIKQVESFLARLCNYRVLDPACGSGNFLYVALELMKEIEGDVLRVLSDFGQEVDRFALAGLTVDPQQFLGIEKNDRACSITELVLWLGFLRAHIQSHDPDEPPPIPVLRDYQNIRYDDAVLKYTRERLARDESGKPITEWDHVTHTTDPNTRRDIPDETARVPVYEYDNPRPTEWPEADFIVGNPPFIGTWKMRVELGGGYAEAIRNAYPDLPDSCDYVMYWWELAARRLLRKPGRGRRPKEYRNLKRFGFITTNSLRQTFNRRVLQRHLEAEDGVSLAYVIPDHPWVDAADGADVRIAMTVAEPGLNQEGVLARVTREEKRERGARDVSLMETTGVIHADLTTGVDVSRSTTLRSNGQLCSRGMSLHGSGFIVTPAEAERLGMGERPHLEQHIRPYRNGRDITSRPRGVMVIDLFGLEEHEVRQEFPEVYQWVLERVKPERDQNRRKSYRENWWVFGEPRRELRQALDGLPRYITTAETAKHRFFVFLDATVLPDNKLVNIGSDDAFILGVLSSRPHVTWAVRAGGRQGVGNDPVYTKTRCFDTFPFPDATEEQQQRIRVLAEELDTFRAQRLAKHPSLTLTQMYNVLEKKRSGEVLSETERAINDKGLISTLLELHQRLDEAVLEAYGWPATLPDDALLERLLELNAQRAEEEKDGLVRWLRPEFQAPEEYRRQLDMEVLLEETRKADVLPSPEETRRPFPRELVERTRAVRALVEALGVPVTPQTVARYFTHTRSTSVQQVLDLLAEYGQLQKVDPDRYVA